MDEQATHYEKVAARFALLGCTLKRDIVMQRHGYILPSGYRAGGYVTEQQAMEAALRRLEVEII